VTSAEVSSPITSSSSPILTLVLKLSHISESSPKHSFSPPFSRPPQPPPLIHTDRVYSVSELRAQVQSRATRTLGVPQTTTRKSWHLQIRHFFFLQAIQVIHKIPLAGSELASTPRAQKSPENPSQARGGGEGGLRRPPHFTWNIFTAILTTAIALLFSSVLRRSAEVPFPRGVEICVQKVPKYKMAVLICPQNPFVCANDLYRNLHINFPF